jgi:D-tyrosyl-tRNA(Tyr) deacylase
LQRVLSASVTVDKQLISSIGRGILVLAAVAPGDTEKDVDSLAAKVVKMRLWDDDTGERVGRYSTSKYLVLENNLILSQWKQNVQDINGEILCGA